MNKFFLKVFCSLVFSFSIAYAEDVSFVDHDPSQIDFDQIVAGAPPQEKRRRTKQKAEAKERKQNLNANAAIPDTWKLKFDYPVNIIQPQNSLYYQFNVGVGFLYFSGVKGNLMGNPPRSFFRVINGVNLIVAETVPLKGSYTYNRTPLFESTIGYRILPWFKVGISYQHQSGVTFQTAALDAFRPDVLRSKADFTSNLSLDGLMAKFGFEGPHPAVIRKIAVSPNLSLGVGLGWQTWRRNMVKYYQIQNSLSLADILPLRQKVSANCIWMADLGLRFQTTDIDSNTSVTMGCKYNQWGQARNIGKLSQQGSQKVALLNPFHIKTVYQFAPYLGVQWNFPNTYVNKSPYTIDGKNPNRFVPMIKNVSNFQPKESLWTQFNAGVGLLYFSNVRANLTGVPAQPFRDPANAALDVSIDAPLQGRLRYNKTPLFEYLIGYRFFPWFKAALSYQHQGNITVQSQAVNNVVDNAAPVNNTSWARFTSNLDLDAIETKFFFELPYPMIVKNVSCSPFLALGVGIGWQTWSKMQTQYYHLLAQFSSLSNLRLHQKISENLVWSGDVGFRWQSAFPDSNFSILTGCKYNQWGQARNMGMLSQQSAHKFGLFDPLKIKTVYQIAPYIGVQWNFSSAYANKRPYSIEGKSVNRWKPFFVNADYLQSSKNFWAQFNVAPGFLYFSDVRANFSMQPNFEFLIATPPSVPYRGRLSYNKTPLFEYILGYQFFSWYKLSLSYQHQGGITIQSKWIDIPTRNIVGAVVSQAQFQFNSNVSLDGITLKNYFELPKALILKGVSTTPYLALGIGPAWQTWNRTEAVPSHLQDGLFVSTTASARQKVSANLMWMVDLGFRLRSALPDPGLNILLGCKYNQWGQARSIGKASQQGRSKMVIFAQPFSIKVVYQFAPYVGVQWNF
ncbi:MAG: hypothetical protein S4CHLAM6_00440 [Chlamydiae bacterium]|nr:hypothetical protein [Chlamydiota bacterium]